MALSDHSLDNDHHLLAVDYRTDPEGNVSITMALGEFEAFLGMLNRSSLVVRNEGEPPLLLKFEPRYLLNGKAAIEILTTECEIVENEPLSGQAADDVIAAMHACEHANIDVSYTPEAVVQTCQDCGTTATITREGLSHRLV